MNKFQDCVLYCKLNSICVKFKFKNNYFEENSDKEGVPHISLYTLRGEMCVVTETGYHSYFWGIGECGEGFNSIYEMIEKVVMDFYNSNENKRKKEKLIFEWVDKNEDEMLEEANKIPLIKRTTQSKLF